MFNSSDGTPFTMNVAPTGAGSYGSDNGMFGGGYAWIWIILIFAIFGFGNGGWGNNSTSDTLLPYLIRQESGANDNYVLASDFASIERQIDSTASQTQGLITNSADQLQRQITSVADGICSLGYDQLAQMNNINNTVTATGNSVLAQMNNNAVNSMQDTFALQTAINGVNVNANTNTQAIIAQMTANEAARQACCCDNKNLISTNFGNLKYDIAAQDCQTRQTINDVGRSLADVQNSNTQAVLAAINSLKDDAKNEKIAALESQLSDARIIANNNAQTAAFQSAINAAVKELTPPTPQPSFVVPNPWNYSGCSGCSCSSYT